MCQLSVAALSSERKLPLVLLGARGAGVIFRDLCAVGVLFGEDCLSGHDAVAFTDHVIENADQQFERLL